MPINANVMELDAARALLQLQCAPRQEVEMEEAVALFLGCLNTEFKQHITPETLLKSSKTSLQSDKETQTAEDVQTKTWPEFHRMDVLISGLYAKINSLENHLNISNARPSPQLLNELDADVYTNLLKVQYDQQCNNTNIRNYGSSSFCNTGKTLNSSYMTSKADDEWKPENYKSSNQLIHRDMLRLRGDDLVQIGNGYASVPAKVLKQMNWSSYTGATRKLLEAVFSRRVLATHSLTGKSSPAFPGKPAKKRLDPELVDDIVQVVVERCHVSASNVRTIITTKCAIESKMHRNRQMNRLKQQLFKTNQENIPPSPCYESFDNTF